MDNFYPSENRDYLNKWAEDFNMDLQNEIRRIERNLKYITIILIILVILEVVGYFYSIFGFFGVILFPRFSITFFIAQPILLITIFVLVIRLYKKRAWKPMTYPSSKVNPPSKVTFGMDFSGEHSFYCVQNLKYENDSILIKNIKVERFLEMDLEILLNNAEFMEEKSQEFGKNIIKMIGKKCECGANIIFRSIVKGKTQNFEFYMIAGEVCLNCHEEPYVLVSAQNHIPRQFSAFFSS